MYEVRFFYVRREVAVERITARGDREANELAGCRALTVARELVGPHADRWAVSWLLSRKEVR